MKSDLCQSIKEEIILKAIAFYILNLFGHSLWVELEEINNCGRKVKGVLVSKYSS